MSTLLTVKNLRVSFKTEEGQFVEAIKGISFDVDLDQTVALVGESGSGKSVTSLTIMGLLPEHLTRVAPDSQLLFEGRDLLKLSRPQLRQLCGKDIAMIFQEPMSSLNPVFTVGSQIAEMLLLHNIVPKSQVKQRVIELLTEVGIPQPEQKYHAYPSQMSGGQQQRVMIAMAIACEPKLLIADEPTTALDVTIQKQIIELLAKIRKKRQMSMIFITHDLSLVGEVADRVVVMRHGEIREQGDCQQILRQPRDIYTRALLLCRPRIDQRPYHLPVTADFMEADGTPKGDLQQLMHQPQRQRGLTGDEEIILDVRNLKKSFFARTGVFKQQEFQAVKGVSFKLAKGKTLGLVGESGSGKTTVGLLLMRLLDATSGEIFLDGRDILKLTDREFAAYQRKIQIIFQNPYASLNPRFTIGKILMEPMRLHQIGQNDEERRHMAFELLRRVSLPDSAFYRYPHEFSGGQRQRIAIARCLSLKPEIIICDESVSALDVSVQAQVLNLFQELQDELGISYIFISHDLTVVNYIADQVMVMNHGELVEMANSDTLYAHPQHPYTRTLLSAIPKFDEGVIEQL